MQSIYYKSTLEERGEENQDWAGEKSRDYTGWLSPGEISNKSEPGLYRTSVRGQMQPTQKGIPLVKVVLCSWAPLQQLTAGAPCPSLDSAAVSAIREPYKVMKVKLCFFCSMILSEYLSISLHERHKVKIKLSNKCELTPFLQHISRLDLLSKFAYGLFCQNLRGNCHILNHWHVLLTFFSLLLSKENKYKIPL